MKSGLVTFVGPMALEMGADFHPYSDRLLMRALVGELRGESLLPEDHRPHKVLPGKAEGRLIGGCLSIVVTLLGTEYWGDISGRILFLEEVGEKPFRIDRMLTHLRNAGVFDKIAGLILGDFVNCVDDEEESPALEDMVRDIIGSRKLPVIAGMPFGHGKEKMTLPLGVRVRMNADQERLVFLEEAVKMK